MLLFGCSDVVLTCGFNNRGDGLDRLTQVGHSAIGGDIVVDTVADNPILMVVP